MPLEQQHQHMAEKDNLKYKKPIVQEFGYKQYPVGSFKKGEDVDTGETLFNIASHPFTAASQYFRGQPVSGKGDQNIFDYALDFVPLFLAAKSAHDLPKDIKSKNYASGFLDLVSIFAPLPMTPKSRIVSDVVSHIPSERPPFIYKDMYPQKNGIYKPVTVITDGDVADEIIGLGPTPVVPLGVPEYKVGPNKFLHGNYDSFNKAVEGVKDNSKTTQNSIMRNLFKPFKVGGNTIDSSNMNDSSVKESEIPSRSNSTSNPETVSEYVGNGQYNINPYFSGFNALAMGVTYAANQADEKRKRNKELEDYIKSIQPKPRVSESEDGLNNIPMYKIGGKVVTVYSDNDPRLRAYNDSLQLYNNMQLPSSEEMYKYVAVPHNNDFFSEDYRTGKKLKGRDVVRSSIKNAGRPIQPHSDLVKRPEYENFIDLGTITEDGKNIMYGSKIYELFDKPVNEVKYIRPVELFDVNSYGWKVQDGMWTRKSKGMKTGGLNPEKARKILEDGKVRGKELTDKQRKFFGSIIKAEAGLDNSDSFTEGQEVELSPEEIKKYQSLGYKFEIL